MSSLKFESPLEYSQMHTGLPYSSAQSRVLYLSKRSRSPWFRQPLGSSTISCVAAMISIYSKTMWHLLMAHQQESFHPFPSQQGLSCFLSHVTKGAPKRHGPNSPSFLSHAGTVTRGICLPVTSWVEVTPVSLAQSMATAI